MTRKEETKERRGTHSSCEDDESKRREEFGNKHGRVKSQEERKVLKRTLR
jgi:hypothetical protein